MVEIGVYSTVGASEVSCRSLAEISAEKCGKDMVGVRGNGREMDENGRKDVVRMV